MKPRTYVLMTLAILALLVMLAAQGCLFGGGGGEEEAEEGGEEMGTGEGPSEGMPGGEEMAGAPEEAGAPAGEGFMAEPAAGEPGGEAAGGGAASLVAAGMTAKHAGDLNAAQQNFEAAVAADPNNVDAHWGLAWVYAQKNLKEKAITEFNKVKALGADEEKVAQADEAIARLSK